MSSDADLQMIQVDFLQESEENNPEWVEMSSNAPMPDSQTILRVDFLALVVVGF
jgi:hypothetical protein